MKAELIKNTNNDLNIVNAARVSFDKEAFWYNKEIHKINKDHKNYDLWLRYAGICNNDKSLSQQDFNLLLYLKEHNHFTPFTHNRITIEHNYPFISFNKLDNTDKTGMVHSDNLKIVRHSLWGWYNLVKKNLVTDPNSIIKIIWKRYPGAAFALFGDLYYTNMVSIYEDLSACKTLDKKFYDITMRETVPIFVARQR